MIKIQARLTLHSVRAQFLICCLLSLAHHNDSDVRILLGFLKAFGRVYQLLFDYI